MTHAGYSQHKSAHLKYTKLLLASPSFYPFYGGAEIRFRRYLPILVEHGITPSVITGTPNAKKITPANKLEDWYSIPYGTKLMSEEFKGIPINRYRLPEKPAIKRLSVFHDKIKEQILSENNTPDVIQFLSPAVDTFRLARKKNIGTVVAYTLAKSAHPNIMKQWLRTRKLRKLFSVPDCIVVSSDEIKSYLNDRGIRNRIEVIANGVDTKEFSPVNGIEEKIIIKQKLGISLDKKILLNVGTVHPRKGTDLLLGAFKLLADKNKDVDLYIVGPEMNHSVPALENFNKEINNLLTHPNLKSRVHFVGVVDNVSDYMKAADIFVFPSREEGMGNVVMEAMASGLPVVVTPYLGFPSIFGNDGENFIMSDFDEKAISIHLEKILNTDSLKEKIVSNSLVRANEHLAIRNSVSEFANLYHKIAR